MLNMVTIVNNTVLYTWNLLKELILSVLTTHKKNVTEMAMLISLIMVTILQCVHTSKYHTVHVKSYTIFICQLRLNKAGLKKGILTQRISTDFMVTVPL